MICEICGKNPATIHIKEIINGEKKSLNICPECASKKSKSDPMLQGFNLADMLYSLSGNGTQAAQQQVGGEPDKEDFQAQTASMLICPVCGWDSRRFRKTGRMGCSNCYNVFRDILIPALDNMHRGNMHVGKVPGADTMHAQENQNTLLEIMKLQKELEELIKREEYEKAALVRDRLNELKHHNCNCEPGSGEMKND